MPATPLPADPVRQRRIDHIRELRDRKVHPERYYGIFSVPNFARIGLLVFTSALAAGAVAAVFGRGALGYVVGAVAVGVTQWAVDRLWRRFDRSAARTWQVIKIVLVGTVAALILLAKAVPSLGIKELFGGWLEDRRTALDANQREAPFPIRDSQRQGQDWVLITLNDGIRRGSRREAGEWCGQLGNGWALPPASDWPQLKPWPTLDAPLWVWTTAGKAQLGDGKPVAVFSSGPSKSSEVAGVLCLYQGGTNAVGH